MGRSLGKRGSTFEEYERKTLKEAAMRADRQTKARALREAGVRGYSGLKIAEVNDLLLENPPALEALKEAVRGDCVHWRWAIARSVASSYGELEEIERAAGVEPDLSKGRRGVYSSWEDVRKVYEAAAVQPRDDWAHVRISGCEEGAVGRIADALAGSGMRCGTVEEKTWGDGTSAWYFDLAVPSAAPRNERR